MNLPSNLSDSATKLWDRRSAALVSSSNLVHEKPDAQSWTREERRLWLYAIAIGRRLERIQ
jgi:hypothetical protein